MSKPVSKFKVGDKVKIITNSHYKKPIRIVKVNKYLFDSNKHIYYLYGVKYAWDSRKYQGFFEEDLIPEEIWNSPLYKLMQED